MNGMNGWLWPWLWPFGMIGAAFMGLWMVIILLAIIFWLWMLIDCLQKEKFNDKLIWILVLLFLFILGAILYYFLVKNKAETKVKKRVKRRK